eukprot:TRINITY_DN14926_c0_g1_i1.p1 TRINITY_DN14926_c0_g1~~TRINITY_DN14926_c0_g1_i1.p1  ORF type:complete len:193 (+),score=54.02 TRINITY_DN14926_c0_g1_i1:65-580(+)
MATVTFVQKRNCCSAPTFQRDWSIHFNGRLSRDELETILGTLDGHWKGLHNIHKIFFGVLLFKLICVVPIVIYHAFEPFFAILGAFFSITLVFLLISIINVRNMKKKIQAELFNWNQFYNQRAINLRFIDDLPLPKLEVEVGLMMPTPQMVPQYVAPKVIPQDLEKQPLLV